MDIKDQTTEDSPPTEEPNPAPRWEYKTELGINARMRELAELTKVVTEGEVDRLRRKLEKLRYGS